MNGICNIEYYSALKTKIKEVSGITAELNREIDNAVKEFGAYGFDSEQYAIAVDANSLYNSLSEELDQITAVCEVYERFERELYETAKALNLADTNP